MVPLNKVFLIDLPRDNPVALRGETMSNELTKELIDSLDLGDFDTNKWECEFLESVLSQTTYSANQKKVVYNMARKYKLI